MESREDEKQEEINEITKLEEERIRAVDAFKIIAIKIGVNLPPDNVNPFNPLFNGYPLKKERNDLAFKLKKIVFDNNRSESIVGDEEDIKSYNESLNAIRNKIAAINIKRDAFFYKYGVYPPFRSPSQWPSPRRGLHDPWSLPLAPPPRESSVVFKGNNEVQTRAFIKNKYYDEHGYPTLSYSKDDSGIGLRSSNRTPSNRTPLWRRYPYEGLGFRGGLHGWRRVTKRRHNKKKSSKRQEGARRLHTRRGRIN